MKTRTLGRGGFEIGEVGMGCWQFGGDFGPMEERSAMAILEAAVENGINFFDTADIYGAGRSEELIGRFLKTCGTPVAVATKFGRGGDVYPDHYSRQALRDAVQASLDRLGLDVIDLLQLHCIPIETIRDGEVFGWLQDLRQEGLIKHFGASVESAEEAHLCMEQDGLLSLQVIFNLFRQKLATELFPQAKEQGVGIIVRLPLASGLLSGKFTKDTQFAESDHRNYNRDGQCFNVAETFAGLPFEKGVELADALKEQVPEGMTMAQMALRWILDHDAVSVVIPGASSPMQARANAAASDLKPLAEGLHEILGTFYKQRVHSHVRGAY
ncbi:aldo/keto reductase [Pontiella sulfatireligans]|uniref:General stress protein 69 n=1 Tax=Pontiella sulfatireligans TaxID=2750658 RepID=A0A6C2UFB4_9BACT|nr:aldo/keto reductase [Pontiella sulfatireligans]VGO18217.1 General stress protein 69 [Pontiella sulfatireligans]